MKKNLPAIFILAFIVLFLSGCLTVEKKEYTFTFTGENSGQLTIKFINIMSTMDDTTDVSEDDFASLINDYYFGNSFESEFPNAQVVDKKIFEEDGKLCAAIILEFSDLASAGLFRYKGKGPYMYCLNCNSLNGEIFDSSNGDYGGDVMPVVFWDYSLKELLLRTVITSPDETTISLLEHYKAWDSNR